MLRSRPVVLATVAITVLLAAPLAAQGETVQRGWAAPNRLFSTPDFYLLLRLPGDRVTVHYTPGSLDRSANLQTRLELVTRLFEKWLEQPFPMTVYVLSPQEWSEAGIEIPYGIPVRVGTDGLAAAAVGDETTVRLWAGLLKGVLPSVRGIPLRGTPQEAASLMVADVFAQLEAAEAFVDRLGLGGGEPWIRGLASHVVSQSLVRRIEPHRLAELDVMYELLSRYRAPRSLSGRDYVAPLGLEDWLWFQAQFHLGAKHLVDRQGKGAVKALRKLAKNGKLKEDVLFRRSRELEDWYRSTFSAVSLRAATAG